MFDFYNGFGFTVPLSYGNLCRNWFEESREEFDHFVRKEELIEALDALIAEETADDAAKGEVIH